MEMYGGTSENLSFNIAGVQSSSEKARRMQLVNEAYQSVLIAIADTAMKFRLDELYKETCKKGLGRQV